VDPAPVSEFAEPLGGHVGTEVVTPDVGTALALLLAGAELVVLVEPLLLLPQAATDAESAARTPIRKSNFGILTLPPRPGIEMGNLSIGLDVRMRFSFLRSC
jgi:hypothetical protein